MISRPTPSRRRAGAPLEPRRRRQLHSAKQSDASPHDTSLQVPPSQVSTGGPIRTPPQVHPKTALSTQVDAAPMAHEGSEIVVPLSQKAQFPPLCVHVPSAHAPAKFTTNPFRQPAIPFFQQVGLASAHSGTAVWAALHTASPPASTQKGLDAGHAWSLQSLPPAKGTSPDVSTQDSIALPLQRVAPAVQWLLHPVRPTACSERPRAMATRR